MNPIASTQRNVPVVVHDPVALSHARSQVCGQAPELVLNTVRSLLDRQAESGGEQINLIASESLSSPAALSVLAHPVGRKMGGGQIGLSNRLFPACESIDDLEALCHEVFCDLFACVGCEYRLTSNMQAVLLAYASLTKPGDKVMVLGLPSGGDTSNSMLGPPGLMGLSLFEIPWDDSLQDIDWTAFERMVNVVQPAMVALSRTVCLFPIDTARIKRLIEPWGGLLYLDAAHELGLIAGGVMQDPFTQGVDVLSGSIGKSFSGPQSGILLWKDAAMSPRILRMAFPTLVSSYQINRVAAITVAALEMKTYGRRFMVDSVGNAQVLAFGLAAEGVAVLHGKKGYTRTHQILMDLGGMGGGRQVSRRLAQAGVLTNQIILPTDEEARLFDPGGIRLGTTWVTRMGMQEQEMTRISSLMADVILERRPVDSVAADVRELVARFPLVYYCFEHGEPTRLPGGAITGQAGQRRQAA